jgi:hypothetical protein
VQKDQPGIAWFSSLLHARGSQLAHLRQQALQGLRTVSLVHHQLNQRRARLFQALLSAASSCSQLSGRWYFRLNIAAACSNCTFCGIR